MAQYSELGDEQLYAQITGCQRMLADADDQRRAHRIGWFRHRWLRSYWRTQLIPLLEERLRRSPRYGLVMLVSHRPVTSWWHAASEAKDAAQTLLEHSAGWPDRLIYPNGHEQTYTTFGSWSDSS